MLRCRHTRQSQRPPFQLLNLQHVTAAAQLSKFRARAMLVHRDGIECQCLQRNAVWSPRHSARRASVQLWNIVILLAHIII